MRRIVRKGGSIEGRKNNRQVSGCKSKSIQVHLDTMGIQAYFDAVPW